MTTVPIHVYRCRDCGRLYATSREDTTSLEIECFGSGADPHEQTFMELVLESSVEATVSEDAA